MTREQFNNLAIGDLVIYNRVGGPKPSKRAHTCNGLVVQVAELNVELTDYYGNPMYGVKLTQPFVKSDFELYITNHHQLQPYNL